MKALYKAGCYRPESFLQYKRTFYDGCVRRLLLSEDGVLYAGTDAGLFRLTDGGLVPACEALNGHSVTLLRQMAGWIAVGAGSTLWKLTAGEPVFVRDFGGPLVDIAERGGAYWVLTEEYLYKSDASMETDLLRRSTEGGKARCMAVSDGAFYVGTDNNLSVIHGKRQEWKNILPRFSDYPKTEIRCAALDENGYLWLGTDDGVLIHDDNALWLTPEKIHTLPQDPVYRIVTDAVGGRYYATGVGVIYQKNGGMKYFSAGRWVPDNRVNDVAVAPDGSRIYAATDKGLAVIEAFETTFAEKAAHFEKVMERHHIRRGFTAAASTPTGDPADAVPDISDNDGLWTGCYVAAESLRYAVTGEQEALEKARRGLNAMLLLTKVTELPGFTARAVRYPGDPGFGDGNKEWIRTADGTCEWKCETSSDEMTGHFFGMSLYYDFCADEAEKEAVRAALCGIMDHIVRNHYRLIDHDGLPTTWANWDPMLLNYDDKWFFERGINSLELLAFLKVCHHITGDEKYAVLYREFVTKHHYPLNAMQHKVRDAHVCHIDDNLGFIAAFTLLRLEENESLRALYLCGMEDHWQYERVERQPMFCFLHAAFTGRDDDLAEGVRSLREMPFDLSFHKEENSKRRGLIFDTEQAEWHEPAQLKTPLPYDERNLPRPDAGAFRIDWDTTNHVQDPTIFLLPYWIGRYYGLLG